MDERTWTKRISEILEEHFKEKTKQTFHVETEQKLPYGTVITGFDENWKSEYAEKENMFATDLVIYEEQGGRIIPRVVIEAKFKNAGTHDAMTYGKKAVLHRSLMPALRYGLMIGAMEDRDLQWRFFEHGGDFDFMFCFKGEEPDEKEKTSFIKLVDSEIKSSKNLEDMFGSKHTKSGIYCLQKELKLYRETRMASSTNSNQNGEARSCVSG